MLRRLLFVSYLFPPANNVGVHRSVRFLKSLPSLGWTPTVLTPRNPKVQGTEPELCGRVAPDLHIERTRSFEALNYGRSLTDGAGGAIQASRMGRAMVQLPRDLWRFVATPDDKIGWIPFATRAGSRVIKTQKIDAIYVSGKPFSSYWIGHILSRRFGIPWVMDLRDLWALNDRVRPRSRLHGFVESRMERTLVRSAAAVIANTPGNRRDFVSHYPDCPPDKFVAITNGFDQDDFEANVAKPSDRFVIAYTGNFYFQKQERTGFYRRILNLDRRRSELYETHSPRFLFQGIAEVLRRRPELKNRIEVRMAGAKNSAIHDMACEYGLQGVVTQLGWLTHEHSMRLLQESHLACVVLSRGQESESWIPSKLYQYLGSGTPILGMLPDGDAAQIIRDTRVGIVVPPDDVERIADALSALIDDVSNGVSQEPDRLEISRYEGRALTAELARVLNSVVDGPAVKTPSEGSDEDRLVLDNAVTA